MQCKLPKNDEKYHWTNHVIQKMLYYGLSADRVKRVIRAPKRAEEGVAEGTIAVMQPAGSKKNPQEIWVMYLISKKANTLSEQRESKGTVALRLAQSRNDYFLVHKKIVISAWRYPGVSPLRGPIPIPEDILAELKDIVVDDNV